MKRTILLLAIVLLPSCKSACKFMCDEIPENPLKLLKSSEYVSTSKLLDIAIINAYKGRKPGFNAFLNYQLSSYDILILQEATSEMNLSMFDSSHMGVNFIMDNKIFAGVVTSAKTKIESLAYYTKDIEPFVRTPKPILISTLYFSSYKLLIVNIHGINFSSNIALKHQLDLSSQSIKAHVGPIIFAGDFNTKNDERIKIMRDFMNNHGLLEINFTGAPHELDHAFYRGLIISKATALNVKESDHPMLSFTATIDNKPVVDK